MITIKITLYTWVFSTVLFTLTAICLSLILLSFHSSRFIVPFPLTSLFSSFWKPSLNYPHPPTQMEDARVGLQASLLVRSPETGELFVNFDPEILTQIREVNCMTRINLEIPPFAALLQQKQDTLKKNYNKLQVDISHSCTLLQRHATSKSNMKGQGWRCISVVCVVEIEKQCIEQ